MPVSRSELDRPPNPHLVQMVGRVARNPYFFAAALGPDATAAAARLGCTPARACHVALCVMPTTRAEVVHMAERFGVDEVRLLEAWESFPVPVATA